MREVLELAEEARRAGRVLAQAKTARKNACLRRAADLLEERAGEILAANAAEAERAAGVTEGFLRRMTMDEGKVRAIAAGVRAVADLPDPVGEVVRGRRLPNGLDIRQVRVPLGVVGVIYESRPNVTMDAAALCLKSGNACLLKGGAEVQETNRALVRVWRQALTESGLPGAAVGLVEGGREAAGYLMTLRDYVDLLIPRGGAGLIRRVVEEAKVPVIETGVGVCHVYVDRSADLEKALRVAVNAKTSNPAVCNAAETLLVDAPVAPVFLPVARAALEAAGVELRGCPATCRILPGVKAATQEDWGAEYLDLILAVRVVDGVEEAVAHVSRYGTRHSETIMAEDYARGRAFLEQVDAAAVYWNASTRFTDGFEFGFGAEIGISTQKVGARGPLGLPELTTTKYLILGDGQVRE